MLDTIDNPFKSISILYRKSHIWLNSSCSQFDLTAAQAVIIFILCDFGELTQDEITKKLALDKSVIAKTVVKLEERGFLLRATNKRDKRTYDIKPTEKALEVYPYIKEEVDKCFELMTRKMSDSERNEFKRLLLLAAESTLALEE